jgi:hypothetical protein
VQLECMAMNNIIKSFGYDYLHRQTINIKTEVQMK